jgi:nucleoside-diphosphate-sugar epimerase
MKLVVIGGSGLIGSKLVPWLREHGHGEIRFQEWLNQPVLQR